MGSQGIRNQDGQLEQSSSTGVARPIRRRTLRGRLANMMFMPIDIFCEVAYYLGPDDLLRLSRSSKVLRELLMSKSSKSIWQQAEKSYGLPERPHDLSSPQYASFIFDLFCSRCMNMRKFNYYVVHRLRLCSPCASASILSGHKLPQRNAMTQMTADEREDIYSLVPRLVTGKYSLFRDSAASKYYVPAFEEAYEQYISISSTSERKDFVRERREIVQKNVSNASVMEDWIKHNRSEDEDNCCYSLQTSRRDTVYKKLRELGYSDGDFVTYNDEENWRWKNLIIQNRELTERIWETIRPQLEETIRLRRAKKHPDVVKRRCDKLTRMTKEFIDSNTSKYCFVAAQDLFQLPTAKKIIENDDPNVDFDDTTWLTIKSEIAVWSETWKYGIEAQIASKILERRSQARGYFPEWEPGEGQCPDSASICRHATTFFIEKWSEYIYPMVDMFDDLLSRFQTEFTETMNNYTVPAKWSFKSRLGIFNPVTALALYRSLGVNASTMDDMAALGKSFVCLCCDPILRTQMSWIELVQHFFDANLDYSERERTRQTDNLIHIPNVNDHVVTMSVELRIAAYTGVSTETPEDNPTLKRWITFCSCDGCKSPLHSYMLCEECRALEGRYISFSCQSKLDAHAQQVHPKCICHLCTFPRPRVATPDIQV